MTLDKEKVSQLILELDKISPIIDEDKEKIKTGWFSWRITAKDVRLSGKLIFH